MLERCFTHPSHRRRGAGNLLVGWGVAKADELGLECFVEAANSGVSLYESHGFVVADVFRLDTRRQGASDEWEKHSREIPVEYTFMWRPRGGRSEKGKTVFPWTK